MQALLYAACLLHGLHLDLGQSSDIKGNDYRFSDFRQLYWLCRLMGRPCFGFGAGSGEWLGTFSSEIKLSYCLVKLTKICRMDICLRCRRHFLRRADQLLGQRRCPWSGSVYVVSLLCIKFASQANLQKSHKWQSSYSPVSPCFYYRTASLHGFNTLARWSTLFCLFSSSPYPWLSSAALDLQVKS